MIFLIITANSFGQAANEPVDEPAAEVRKDRGSPPVQTDDKNPFMILLPLGYDFMRMGTQMVHRPATGIGFLSGEQDLPFTQVERRFLGLALYQPFFLKEEPLTGIPQQFHQIDF